MEKFYQETLRVCNRLVLCNRPGQHCMRYTALALPCHLSVARTPVHRFVLSSHLSGNLQILYSLIPHLSILGLGLEV